MTGYFQGDVDFDPGVGVSTLTGSGNDIFVSKLDASGNLVWARAMDATNTSWGQGIGADGSGNVYTTGFYQGDVDLDPGIGTANFTSAGNKDIFIQKLDSSGNLVWAKSIGGTESDIPNDIALDGSGNPMITGSFKSTVDFDPGLGSSELTSTGSKEMFVWKLTSSGNLDWVAASASSNGSSGASGSTIEFDGADNVYLRGSFDGTVDFDPGAGVADLTRTGNGFKFLQKLDSSGNFVWVMVIEGKNGGTGGIALDGSGSVYFTETLCRGN